MLKEIKYLIFIVIILLFIFLTGKYYFSDENIKKSYRSYKNIDEPVANPPTSQFHIIHPVVV